MTLRVTRQSADAGSRACPSARQKIMKAQRENGPVRREQDEPERRRRIRVLLQPVDRADQHDLDGRKNRRSVPLPGFLVRRSPESFGRLVQQELGGEMKGVPERKEQEDECL